MAARDNQIVGRRKHPDVGVLNVCQRLDCTSASNKLDRLVGQRLRTVEHVADRKCTIKCKYPRQSAPGASAAYYIQYLHAVSLPALQIHDGIPAAD